ncbi:MAG: CDP-alcohol phosphatidyltransferase family protein [Longibaculum muris]|uniref:CDP-diacylglycerol--serine O-phosphatidyltransferase n=1 Tax=Longibaculum muris TaxID=1796628 RepID=A0A4R3Z5I2_9FIRM|nr:CDP-alcohol phosphatidyltransferase family protein [Longibaculum muris]KXU52189.1 CDP-alcohol phosphatidyltransferase [Candidatus Stoquefichus sp. KLE1796]MBS5369758.1 CDP-alcohol phosphatidyltransferase family protein [Coprobacillus cateniformis]MCR1887606.1 CDP-alcohol phosphatidyltransferase family protein [Longibaculum muris]MED9811875.1 CDP-alcohol phosphatidyltransferase family protein [Longibaculum muris]TCW00675.1 CDP-diacylglycerol--serine O-phosphatidyltransferase [Longibaculum mu
MIGYYNYTVILTYLSLISALFGTHLAFRGEPVGALICLLLCGAFDSFDGMVARTKKGRTEEEKKFGIQIDSLVDMFSFGIFPAIIGYTMGLNGWLWFAIFALYAICAVSRLGYFNVAEEMRQKETTEKRKYYQGLPVTSSSLIFPAVYLLKAAVGLGTMQGIYGIMMLVVALAFVIDFKVIKPGLKGILAMGVVGVFIFIGLILL